MITGQLLRRASAACLLILVASAAALLPVCVSADTNGNGIFASVTAKARALAAQPYSPPDTDLPQALAHLTHDQYQNIRFRAERALWHGHSLFEVEFFHLGFLYRHPVTIHAVDDETVNTIAFNPDMFDYGNNEAIPPNMLEGLGFAGFRLDYPLNQPDHKDPVISFLGASYFRVLGRGQSYGVSPRGLAIDTALPQGEEFPRFVEFWLCRPHPKDVTMTFYALLDSKSITGAYRFRLYPGKNTTLDVNARLFARKDIRKLGIAPLTSMFLHGEDGLRSFDDIRPEVHDSDGLLMHTASGEWIWRPLINPHELRVTALLGSNLRGFGLMQRDRDFTHYLDLQVPYQREPSIWVRPSGGNWGKGSLQLVEIPSQRDIDDNIVAFWVPDSALKAHQTRTFSYRLEVFGAGVPTERLARVARTRTGRGIMDGTADPAENNARQFVVDFRGGELSDLVAAQPVKAELSHTSGEIKAIAVTRLPDEQGWRAAFQVHPQGKRPVDMRLFLTLRGRRLSETWSYVWYPEASG
jgi:glucans biosynthesis protein